MNNSKFNLEVDNTNFNKPFLTTHTYTSLIIDEIRNIHLIAGINCNFNLNGNYIYLRIKPQYYPILSSDIIYKVIQKKSKDYFVGRYLFPIKGIKIVNNLVLRIETRFYAPLLIDVLQAPWLIEIQDFNLYDKINFMLNLNSIDRLKKLSRNEFETTWPANGNVLENKKIKGYTLHNFSGNNIFAIKCNNNSFANLIKNCRESIFENLRKYILLKQFDPIVCKKISKCKAVVLDKEVYKLGYLDYFPNKEICEAIVATLSDMCMVKLVNLGSIEQIKQEDVDAELYIVAPTFYSKFSVALELLPDVKNDIKFEVLKRLYNCSKQEILNVYSNTQTIIPLLASRNIYWQKDCYKDNVFDEFGRLDTNALAGF